MAKTIADTIKQTKGYKGLTLSVKTEKGKEYLAQMVVEIAGIMNEVISQSEARVKEGIEIGRVIEVLLSMKVDSRGFSNMRQEKSTINETVDRAVEKVKSELR